ncbi:TonB-dependent haem/haemoglobin receptor [Shewanella denitrificans OS217]|uniref:TonB-dependent haem/haemoglobin receptor n=1 Tax=Shewanella denitrificans (strain OS217 / ATCC BAA-1090 / DSM 15013) TaxID=318161 RepID=Q12L93_SHEDO|nr:TonB-dependent receptor [Shewanella denitrificans]ABE55783.1 TonB-dependent haem/haemoglobin receptor [Shewanella denitrificans OS217]
MSHPDLLSRQNHNVSPSTLGLTLACILGSFPCQVLAGNVLGVPKVTGIEVIEVSGIQHRRPMAIVTPGEALITMEQLEEMQASSFAEVIDDMAGAHIDGGTRSGGERINIWGFGETEDLNVYVDNAPVGFEQYRYGSFFIDPDLLKQVEVIKGAHDVRSGNGGFGGAIYAVTKSASDFLKHDQSFGSRVKASYASNNETKGYTATSYATFSPELSALLHITGKEADDTELATGEAYAYSGFEQQNYLGKLDFEQGDHQLALSFTRYLDEGRKPWANRRGAMPTISDYNIKKYGSYEQALYATTSDNTYRENTWSANYRYSPSNPLIDTQVAISHSSNDRHWIRPDIAWEKMFVSVGSFGHESWLEYKRDFVDINNLSRFGNHELITGLQYRSLDRNSLVFNKSYQKKAEKNFGLYTPYYQPSGRQDTYAAYIQDRISLTDELTIKPSLRYDYIYSVGRENLASDYNDLAAGHDYSATDHSGWSPRFGLEYRLSTNHQLSFDYAYSLMAPVVDEIYAVQYAKASITATSPEVELERLHAYKLGLTSSFSDLFAAQDRLATQVTLFANHGENDIAQRRGENSDKSLPLQSNYTNLDGYKMHGVDIEAQYRVARFFSDLAASWQAGTHNGSLRDSQGDDEYLANIAPLDIKLRLGYYLTDELSLAWQGAWYDAQDKVPSEDLFNSELPSDNYFLQHATLAYEPQGSLSGLTLRLMLKNITNVQVTPFLSDGIPAAGRDVRLSAAYSF